MAEIPRLNGIIKALEAGKHAIACFQPAEIGTAVEMATSKYDAVVWEMEHLYWDGKQLRDTLQYSLNRWQIVAGGSLAPQVTPLVRIPVNGVEKNQWFAKQALDMGFSYCASGPMVRSSYLADEALGSVRLKRQVSAKA